MAFLLIDSYTTLPQAMFGSDTMTITQDGFLQTLSGTSISVTQTNGELGQLQVLGTVTNNSSFYGDILEFDGQNFNVFIGQTGTLSSTGNSSSAFQFDITGSSRIVNHGVISVTGAAIDITQSGSSAIQHIYNSGQIFGASGMDIALTRFAYIHNTGTVHATYRAIDISTSSSTFLDLTNSGEIYSKGDGLYFSSTSTSAPDVDILNSGTISAHGMALRFGGDDNRVKLLNSGEIFGDWYAIYSPGSNSHQIENAGNIHGTVTLGTGNDTLVNSGLIQGSVSMGAGNDVVDLRHGTVTGTVYGGSGNDTYYIDQQGVRIVEFSSVGTDVVRSLVNHTLQRNFEHLVLDGADDINGFGNELGNQLNGNDGNNRIGGRGGNDTLYGGGGADTLMGGTGNDSVNGDDGNDRISLGTGNDEGIGGNGDDVVQGSLGNDLVTGGNGADTLLGNQGADTLQGGNGDDLLIGGTGQDMMAGGNGGDVFLFRLQGDSRIGSHDRIFDFDVTEDRLDLSPLGIQDINLLSTFSYGGAPSVRTTEIGSSTQIFIDLDGLGGADMRIDLSGTTGLGVEDFIF
ncbi:calcium-binding protein [Shimia sp. MIT1388]|uniref:calcium-binding protein n=1 Tax=Shimia sp. MIT1388 TaxID=3096992 RepID=UPI00399A2FBD